MVELTRREFGMEGAIVALTVAALATPIRAAVADAFAIPTTWDLTPLYANVVAWDQASATARAKVLRVAAAAASLGTDAVAFEDALTLRSDCRRAVARLATYAALAADVALGDGAAQERRQRADALSASLDDASSQVDDAIRRLGRARVTTILASRPQLARFRRGLDRTLATTTPGSAEAAASQAATAAGEIYQQLSASIPHAAIALADGRIVSPGTPEYRALSTSDARTDREAVSRANAARLRPFVPVFAATLGAYARARAEAARAEGYPDVLTAVLAADAIPAEVPVTVIAQARAGLPVLHRYVELRRRLGGTPRLRLFELSPPPARHRPTFPLERIRATTLAAVAPLGAEYSAMFARATLSRWMDCFPRSGKYAGGYTNYGACDVHPYLLLNLGHDYMAASTFAHEWGHAMHAVLAHAAQPYELSDLSTFSTEVASTCHEQLLVRHMIETATDADERLFYLWQKALYQVGFFFRTAMQTEFEQFVHGRVAAGEGLSGEGLCAEWRRLLQLYWGPAVELVEDDGYGWAGNWQLYNAFYNFQYATSVTGAVHFASRLRADPGAAMGYLAMLRAGGSVDPYPLLKAHGVDLAATAPYTAFLADLTTTLDLIDRPTEAARTAPISGPSHQRL